MEIIAVGGVHVQSEHPSAKSDCSIDDLLTFTPISETPSTSQNTNEDGHAELEHQGGFKTNLFIAQHASKKEFIAKNSNSKIRPKNSSKLSQIIETCKKLQAHQNSVNVRQEGEKVSSISPEKECREQFNSCTSEVDASLSMSSEPTVNQPELTTDDFCLHKENGNESSSNSINLSPPSNDSIVLSSQFTSESASDLVLKKFLFLFRPSDHEVLVRNKGINMYRCNVCGGMYRQKFSLKRHFLRSHINFQYISKADISNCKIAVPADFVKHDSNAECGKMSNGRKKFKSSNAIFLENNKTRVMPGLYICHICVGVKFDFEQELRDHYNKHSDAERKKFQCDKCSASFFKKQILSRHLASHGEKVAQKACRRCGSEFSSKIEYQKHLASHSSGRVCKYCSKILSTSANRKRHESLHLGVKPYRCTHCGLCFAQGLDLDKHLRKQHNDLCHFCDDCCKLFPSQASLNVHMHEIHSDAAARKAENSSSPEPAPIPSVAKSDSVPVTVPVKLKVCFVCKRSFPTFYAMMKHRSQAHPFHTKRRRNRKTMKQKMAAKQAAKELNHGMKVQKQYVKTSQHKNFPNAPVRRGRPRIERSVQFGQQNDRPDRRLLTKRERELAKKDENEFYCSLSEKIAENLLHFVDGKISQLSLKQYNFNDQRYPSCNFEERGRLPWSNYNFPNEYDVDHALKTRGQEVKNKMPENLSNRDKCLFATGLNRVQNSVQTVIKVPVEKPIETHDTITETIRYPLTGFHKQKINIEERKKLIGKEVSVICVCYICRESFESNVAFKEHCVNNHPNVDCPSIEIEGDKETPPVIPDNLYKHKVSPEGVFFTWNVPPPLSDKSVLKCTKCKSSFQTSFELHSHIIVCGNLKSSPRHVWKFNVQKRIKGTMKNRMSLTQQAAIAYRRDFKTPEKYSQSTKFSKSNEKNLRSAEKSQFYKSGRLQTTSFTVDMNYFKTKPVKPTTTVSKRGRKSYATLSYRYRNASMQSSSSLECSSCKEVFSSQLTLNLHLQSHCIRALSKKNELCFQITDSSQNKIASASTVKNITSAGTTSSSSKMSFPVTGRIKNFHTTSSLSVNNNTLCLSSNTLENNLKNASNVSNTEKVVPIVNSKISSLPETPIDLSKNSNDESFISLDLSNKLKDSAIPKKSALDIAMKAIKDFYQSSEDNEHISKLQKTVEKLPISNNNVSSVLPMTPTHKRVGRPKKVKRLGPFHYRKNLLSATNKETSSKLVEESVKKIEESNPKSDLPSSPNTSAFKQANSSGNSNQNVTHLNTSFDVNLVQPAIPNTDRTMCKDINTDSEILKTSSKTITINTDKNFVPIIIFGDQHKSNKAFVFTDDNMNIDKLKQNVSENSSVHKHPLHGKTMDKTPEKMIQFDDSLTLEKTIDLPNTLKTESPGKKSDKSHRSSGSQGRISPSLESIVNSIKQKLHSQEQETSPNDDVAIAWLEDEKFEIPSRQKLRLPVNSNSNSSLSLDNEQVISSSDANPSNCQMNSDSMDLQQNSGILLDSATKITSTNTHLEKEVFNSNHSQNAESLSLASTSFPPELQDNIRSDENSQDSSSLLVFTSKNSEIVSTLDNKPSEILLDKVSEVQNSNISVSTTEKEQNNAETSVSNDKCRKKKAVNFSVDVKRSTSTQLGNQNQELRRRPGRPRKKMLELNTKTAVSIDNSLSNTVSDSQISSLSEENVYDKIGAKMNDALKEAFVANNHSSQETELMQSSSSHCYQESSVVEPESDESQNRPCSSTSDATDGQHENNSSLSKMSSLRAFRAKLKPTQASNLEMPSTAGSGHTTEFGKILASRMKEKMRLSFENASVENLIRSDECSSMGIPDATTSDANSQISDDDSEYIKAIKKEFESSDPTKKHSCPFCMLEFAYLTNFRRHLHTCRTREEKKVESIPNTSTTVVQHLPKKDEVEHSMLHLLRHQNRQTAMLQEAEKSTGSKVESKFRTYSCNVCHRIYLSLFKLLQHQVTHKLVSQDTEQNALGADVDDPKDLNEIEKYSDINELEESANSNSEICKDIQQNHDYKFISDQDSVETKSSHNELLSNESLKKISHFIDDVQKDESEIIDDPQNISLLQDSMNNKTENINFDMPKNSDINAVTKHSDVNKIIKNPYVCEGTENSITKEALVTTDVKEVTKNSVPVRVTKKSDAIGVTESSAAVSLTDKPDLNKIVMTFDAVALDVKAEEQPVKRKRGRPFGWRKNANNMQENKVTNILQRNFNKVDNAKSVLLGMKKKGDKLVRGHIKRGRRKLLFTRIKSKHTKLVANKIKASTTDKQLEFSPAIENELLMPNSSSEKMETKSENSNSYIFQDLPITNEEVLKFSVKHCPMKSAANKSNISKQIFHTKVPRGKRSILVGSTSNITFPVHRNKLNQVIKRPRGRPPFSLKSENAILLKTEGSIILKPEGSVILKTEESVIQKSEESFVVKPEISLKRRPGRPPKNLSPTPSTSQSKGIQSGGNRNFRKTMARYIPKDSSDSESDIQEKLNSVPKKKILRNCPICKERFPASLILYRHIQLVHSRRTEDDVIKTEASKATKVYLKHIPKSHSDFSADVTKGSKKLSPKTPEVDKYDSTTEVNKKTNSLTKYVHSSSNSTRIFKKVSPKSLDENFHIAETNIYKKMNTNAVDLSNSDTSTTNIFKKVVSKSVAADNSNTDRTKLYKKTSTKSSDLKDSDSSITKVSKKVVTKSLGIDNSDTDGTRFFKKSYSKSTDLDDSDASSTKVFRKAASKSLLFDNADTGEVKVCKKANAKATEFDDSDVSFTKFFRKVSKSPIANSFDSDEAKVSQKVKATDLSDSNSNITKIFKRVVPKSLAINKPDVDETGIFKKVGKKAVSTCNSKAKDTKVSKTVIPKSLGITKAGSNRTKILKKSAKSIASDNSDTDSAKGLNKTEIPESVGITKAGANHTKVLKKSAKSIVSDNSDTDSAKGFNKRVLPKSVGIVKAGANNIKLLKKSAKSIVSDNYNTNSTKDLNKTVIPKSVGIPKAVAIHAKHLKKSAKTAVIDNSNSNSAKDCNSVNKTVIPKSLVITKTAANRAKLLKKSAKSITSDNSDTDSAKGLNRHARKSVTVYNSDNESFKDLRKGILKSVSVDNSDADSDFSVKTDITPLKSSKMCPICKEKFSAILLLSRHIQMVHSRRSTSSLSKSSESSSLNKEAVPPSLSPPVKAKSKLSSPIKMKSLPTSPTKMRNRLSLPAKIKNRVSLPMTETIDSANRGTLSRQCVKPLPPMKRKWAKREENRDQIKKTKLN